MNRRGLRGRRRGSALILVLLMTLAVAALAVAAIFMSSSATLLSRFYDKERLFAYAAQSGIARVVSRLQLDSTFAIASTTPVSALDLTTLTSASGDTLRGLTVRVWAARTGDTTSTGPITISLLAQVADASGTRYVRRVDLRRMHFGEWSFMNNYATSSSSLPFFNSAFVPGRVHNNQGWVTITQASYRDSITSAGTIGVTNASNLRTGAGPNQRRIPWPNPDTLLTTYRLAADTFDISSSRPARVEFVWLDLDADTVADRDEGFMRIFEAAGNGDDSFIDRIEARPQTFSSGSNDYVDWDDRIIQNQCGAFYRRNSVWQFIPVATHRTTWADSLIRFGAGVPAAPIPTSGNLRDNSSAAVRAILSAPTARCFPSGSPYLVNTERFTDNGGTVGIGSSFTRPFGVRNVAHRYGGQDTTFSTTARQCNLDNSYTNQSCSGGSIYTVGSWRTLSAVSGREALRPLDRNGRGAVVHFDSDIRLGGVVAGRVSIAVDGAVSIVDHLTYAGGPNTQRSDCSHLLGVIARSFIRVEENLIAHRARVGSGSGASSNSVVMLGGADHFPLHGAFLSISYYFGVEGNDFRQSNSNTSNCEASSVSMGCIRHLGSTASSETRTFSTNDAQGRGGRYVLTPDACMETSGYRPPLYPGSNRYKILRSVDVRATHAISDAARTAYFASLQGTSDIP